VDTVELRPPLNSNSDIQLKFPSFLQGPQTPSTNQEKCLGSPQTREQPTMQPLCAQTKQNWPRFISPHPAHRHTGCLCHKPRPEGVPGRAVSVTRRSEEGRRLVMAAGPSSALRSLTSRTNLLQCCTSPTPRRRSLQELHKVTLFII
jgi:hypothetical protein